MLYNLGLIKVSLRFFHHNVIILLGNYYAHLFLVTTFLIEKGLVYATGLNDFGQLGTSLSTTHSLVCDI